MGEMPGARLHLIFGWEIRSACCWPRASWVGRQSKKCFQWAEAKVSKERATTTDVTAEVNMSLKHVHLATGGSTPPWSSPSPPPTTPHASAPAHASTPSSSSTPWIHLQLLIVDNNFSLVVCICTDTGTFLLWFVEQMRGNYFICLIHFKHLQQSASWAPHQWAGSPGEGSQAKCSTEYCCPGCCDNVSNKVVIEFQP